MGEIVLKKVIRQNIKMAKKTKALKISLKCLNQGRISKGFASFCYSSTKYESKETNILQNAQS